jgi:hypothetical protein
MPQDNQEPEVEITAPSETEGYDDMDNYTDVFGMPPFTLAYAMGLA